MNYRTIDEFQHFIWKESFLGDVQVTENRFHLVLDNVTIEPENSCNRDIRQMRCNEMLFTLENPKIVELIEEGYKTFDADGNPMQTVSDVVIPMESRCEKMKSFVGGELFDLVKEDNIYTFYIDALEQTYRLKVEADHDVEEWDRFLTKESSFSI